MRRAWLLVAVGCFGKPPRPDGDAGTDAGEQARPRLIGQLPAARTEASSLAYPIAVPDQPDPYLLVTLQVGSHCDDGAPPVTLAEAQLEGGGARALTSLARITGTPCLGTTHSELFELRAPAPGAYTIVVAVAGVAPSLHSAALVFASVDDTEPTRTTVTASGEGARTRVEIPSREGELIVNATGHGAALVAPREATEIFRVNVDTTATLDNSGASFAPGTGEVIETAWDAAALDQWQTISAALRPPGAP